MSTHIPVVLADDRNDATVVRDANQVPGLGKSGRERFLNQDMKPGRYRSRRGRNVGLCGRRDDGHVGISFSEGRLDGRVTERRRRPGLSKRFCERPFVRIDDAGKMPALGRAQLPDPLPSPVPGTNN